MRAKSLLFKRMASWCAANFGASSVSIFWRVGLVSAALRFEKVRCARSSNRPVRSSPTTVLSKVGFFAFRSEEHTSELQSHHDLVCRLLLEKKNDKNFQRRRARS